MANYFYVILTEDYVGDLPQLLRSGCIKSNKELLSDCFKQIQSKSNSNFYFIVATYIDVGAQFVKLQALRNDAQGENDMFELFIPNWAIQCMVEDSVSSARPHAA